LLSPSLVGLQGLGNLGVNRVSTTDGIGGLVLSASSESLSVLIRALKTQGRVDVLSYPTLVTTDNQAARINAGQDVPYISTVTFTGTTGFPTQSIDRRQIGVILTVVPRISPEGRVLMRVTPEISSLGQTLNLGNGNVGQVFNVQNVDTTIAANDGETVMIGGLVTKRDSRVENKVPVLGDIPVLGALFRFRSRTQAKTELIVILTPHVIRSKFDADRVLAEHASKMKWNLCDVAKIHEHGTELMQPREGSGACNDADPSASQKILSMPIDAVPLQAPQPVPVKPATGGPTSSKTIIMRPSVKQAQATEASSPARQATTPEGPTLPILAAPEATPPASEPSNQGKESQSWSVTRPRKS
jgi:hypothetical protein